MVVEAAGTGTAGETAAGDGTRRAAAAVLAAEDRLAGEAATGGNGGETSLLSSTVNVGLPNLQVL